MTAMLVFSVLQPRSLAVDLAGALHQQLPPFLVLLPNRDQLVALRLDRLRGLRQGELALLGHGLAGDERRAGEVNEQRDAQDQKEELIDTGMQRLVGDLDEGFQEWRYRHVKMVERTIGVKRGTGGSTGAEYLHGTIGKPAFPDLWERWITPVRPGHVMLDLWTANEDLLERAGADPLRIENARVCTACHRDVFYSYRKGDRGRLVTVAAMP